jgi:hypothetical protein
MVDLDFLIPPPDFQFGQFGHFGSSHRHHGAECASDCVLMSQYPFINYFLVPIHFINSSVLFDNVRRFFLSLQDEMMVDDDQ